MKSKITKKAAIGDSIARVEDDRLLKGAGRFVDDLALPDMLYAQFVRSPHAHAKIKNTDVTRALSAKGVKVIVSADDLEMAGIGKLKCLSFPKTEPAGTFCPERPLLASGEVRFVGEGVLMVVADTWEHARDACDLIDIEYTNLPAVTLFGAHGLGAPQVWPDADGNRAFSILSGDEGEVSKIFEGAFHISKLRVDYPRATANTMETRGSIAWTDPVDGRYNLCVSSQEPWGVKETVSEACGVSSHDLRVITGDVGGGFGMKGQVYPEDILVLHASILTGRPVKWTADRTEAISTDTHGRGPISNGQLALDQEGKILAFRTDVDVDVGAYLTGWAAVPPRNAAISYPGMYDVPAIFANIRATYTNTAFFGPYRGSGKPEASYLLERLIEQAANEMGLDPIEVRRRNLIPPDVMPYSTPGGYVYDSGNFEKVLDGVLKLSGWDDFEARREASKLRGLERGIGLSLHCQRAGTFSERMEIRIDAEANAALHVGTQSTGQGHETMFAQMVSGWLGVSLGNIRVFQGDTDKVLFGRGTFAQRSMVTGGSALKAAADIIIEKGKKFASFELEASEADIEFQDGIFVVSGTDKKLSIKDVAKLSYQGAGIPQGLGVGLDGVGNFEGVYSFPNGGMVAEVEVDTETGLVVVDKLYAVDDIGLPINPTNAHGQLHGSVAMGVGECLIEEIIYDPDTGQLLTGSFMDYGIPRADIMPDIISEFENDPARTNPIGAKGGSEAGNCGVPAAVFHAIQNALNSTGFHDIKLPATPERIWRALQET